jgi:hypothetical protein
MALTNFGRVLFCIMAFMPLIYGQKLDKCFNCPSSSPLLPFNSSIVDFETCVNATTTTETKVECDAGVKTNLSSTVWQWIDQKNRGESRIPKNNETVSFYQFPAFLLTVGPETSSDATNASSTTPFPTIATTATNPEYCFNMLINFDAEKIYAVQCLNSSQSISEATHRCQTFFDKVKINGATFSNCAPAPITSSNITAPNNTAPNVTAPNNTAPNSLTPQMPQTICCNVTMIIYQKKDCSSPKSISDQLAAAAKNKAASTFNFNAIWTLLVILFGKVVY